MKWIKISLILVVSGIVYLSLKPPSGGVEIKINDKVGHLIAYSVLTINAGLLFPRNKWVFAALCSFFLSCMLEYLQGFVPGRTVDWKDLIANLTGVVIGLVILYTFGSQTLKTLKKIKLVE